MNITSTNLSTDQIYQALVADYSKYQTSFESVTDQVNLVFNILGILSSFLTLLTVFRNDSFTEPCFVCYQAIAWFSGSLASVQATYYWSRLNKGYAGSSYAWQVYLIVLRQPLATFFEYSSVAVTVALNLHRAVASLTPMIYRKVNKRSVCYLVIVVAPLLSSAFAVPRAFRGEPAWNNATNVYTEVTTVFGKGPGYTMFNQAKETFRLIQAVAVSSSSALAIVGMLRAAYMK